jgi:hypothetical protein
MICISAFVLCVTAGTADGATVCPGGEGCSVPGPFLEEPYRLRSNESDEYLLEPDQCMQSQSETFKLCFQSNGDLVLYDGEDQPKWSIMANSTPSRNVSSDASPAKLLLGNNGRLQAFDDTGEEPYWVSPVPTVEEEGPFEAVLGDDGTLNITRLKDMRLMWSTAAGEEKPNMSENRSVL